MKLDGVRTVIIAWADELFEAREGEALEVVLAEIPKDASRIVVADRMTPDVEALVERHLRRASRQGVGAEERDPASLPIRYVSTTPAGRHAAFRRLLDDLDPPSVIVLASDAKAVEEARAAVASLGFEGDASVRVEGAPIEEQAALVVFYDLPVTAEAIAKVEATAPAQVVALVTPRQVPALRRLTTGAVEPLDVSRAAMKARARDERVRSAIRAELQAGLPGARGDGAGASLLGVRRAGDRGCSVPRLIERNRRRKRATRRSRTTGSASRRAFVGTFVGASVRSGRMRIVAVTGAKHAQAHGVARGQASSRVCFSVSVTATACGPGDLVGAITGESGITSDRIGKLEIRDGHSVAEIAVG